MRDLIFVLLFLPAAVFSQEAPFVSSPLTGDEDMSLKMVKGIAKYLDREIAASEAGRTAFWNRDYSDDEKYEASLAPNRERLARITGVSDKRTENVVMEYVSDTDCPAVLLENDLFTAYRVKWNVLEGINGEGILLQPKGTVRSRVVVIPDAGQVPEELIRPQQYARKLAGSGCQVIIPVVIDRDCKWSGNGQPGIATNQPHREWIYRQSFTFGRHIIGWEIQKVLSAVDWFAIQNRKENKPIGIAGWGEGGLIGFYAAAIDTRISSALISGYFEKRDSLWKEPIYRNLSGILKEFGDAEIASMIAPRTLVTEYSECPQVSGPPPAQTTPVRMRAVAAPGYLRTPSFAEVITETARAKKLSGAFGRSLTLVSENGKITGPMSDAALKAFLVPLQPSFKGFSADSKKTDAAPACKYDKDERMKRQVRELEKHVQGLIASSGNIRENFFWKKAASASDAATWENTKRQYQDYFWEDIIGKIPDPGMPLNPKSRKIMESPRWTGYEVTIDVLPDVFAWGYLLLPKDMKPGEKRPVIVCQHGLSGVPSVLMDTTNRTYKGFAVMLANRGYIVFAPHFPWRQEHDYRNLQKRANSLGLTIFSFILNQNERLLDWLSEQPFTDISKIGFYGLSWGGKVAMRVPALLDRYSLSICSGDFNEWIGKNASTSMAGSYMFSPEYEMFDFNLGMTFGHAEMAAMIAPRAFMVERGHGDGVGMDEWVAYEYARVRRFYDRLGIGDQTEIEFFNGVHEINFKGTIRFIEEKFGKP